MPKVTVLSCSLLLFILEMGSSYAMRVLVTGAGGQTGQHVFRKLLARPDYNPIGTVRSEASRKALIERIGEDKSDSVALCDITNEDTSSLDVLIKDCDALMICTSAKPAPTGEINEETKRYGVIKFAPKIHLKSFV